MATLSPSLNAIRQDTGLYRELDVLERLQESLPAGYDIFHSVAWHSVENGQDRHGEIDIVVLGPTGHLLLMEIKSGGVQLRNDELFKLYSSREHDVRRQLAVQRAALLHRLKEAGLHAFVSHCLVLPDYRLEAGDIVALSRDRIIDAADFPFLGTRVQELMRHGDSQSDIESLRRFLSNEFQVSVDLSALDQQLQRTTQRLAEGLATWVPRIQVPHSLIGHLHIPDARMEGKTLFLNPGSISQPRGLINERLYAKVEINDDRFKVDFYTRNHELYPSLSKEFSR